MKGSQQFGARHDPWLARCPKGFKIRYRTRKAALSAMNTLRAEFTRDKRLGAPVAVYQCEVCRDWHMSSTKTRHPRPVSR
jgi:hypothetical protein